MGKQFEEQFLIHWARHPGVRKMVLRDLAALTHPTDCKRCKDGRLCHCPHEVETSEGGTCEGWANDIDGIVEIMEANDKGE